MEYDIMYYLLIICFMFANRNKRKFFVLNFRFLPMFFGVTLMELIIALAMLGLGLVAILNMVNGGMTNTDRLRQEIIAINLSREGVETVYNIRNTNRMRRAGQKDACWLKRDSFDTEGNASCSDDQWLIS